jgi:hypothetical protein
MFHHGCGWRDRRRSPPGVDLLLRIAAGDEAATSEAAAMTGRSRDVIRSAAGFFIEQLLLCPDADSYRVLGLIPAATNAELRRNMALLMRWLHPDLDPQGQRSIFASRVALAWNDLKTADRRTAYDQRGRSLPTRTSRGWSKKSLRGERLSSSRHAPGPHTDSRFYADEKHGLLWRFVGWVGALAHLHLR